MILSLALIILRMVKMDYFSMTRLQCMKLLVFCYKKKRFPIILIINKKLAVLEQWM